MVPYLWANYLLSQIILSLFNFINYSFFVRSYFYLNKFYSNQRFKFYFLLLVSCLDSNKFILIFNPSILLFNFVLSSLNNFSIYYRDLPLFCNIYFLLYYYLVLIYYYIYRKEFCAFLQYSFTRSNLLFKIFLMLISKSVGFYFQLSTNFEISLGIFVNHSFSRLKIPVY